MRILVVALLALSLAGCAASGLKTIPTTGVIVLDGQPVRGANVMFTPTDGGPLAYGMTDEQGIFHLTTGDQEGAVLGSHVVTVELQETTGLNVGNDGLESGPAKAPVQVKWVVPEKYSKPGSSGLSAQVAEESQEFRFELQSKS